MKILVSVIALVLVGLTGGWLWMDATTQARQQSDGIVITGAVDPETASALANAATGETDRETGTDPGATDSDAAAPTTSSTAQPSTLDQVVTLLSASSEELVARAGESREAEAAKTAAEQEAAEQEAAEQEAAEQEAAEQRAQEQRTQQEQRRSGPIPVQPAPVTPNGSCEWDDDHAEWDCEDDGGPDDNGGDRDDDDDDDDDDDR